MKLRDPKTTTLLANQLMEDIEMAGDHSMLAPEVSKSLVFIARKSISSLIEQVVNGVISVGEWHAMVMDIKDIICGMLQEARFD